MFRNSKELELSNSQYDRATYINHDLIFSDQYIEAIKKLGENKYVTKSIIASTRAMLTHHHGDKYEDLYFIDTETNKIRKRTDYKKETQKVEPSKSMMRMLKDNPNIIGIHNHPTSAPPSIGDIIVCAERKYKYGLVICHNGTIYQYKVFPNYNVYRVDSSLNIFSMEEASLINIIYDKEALKYRHNKNMSNLIDNLLGVGVELKEVLWYGENL